MMEFKIGDRRIGKGHPTLIVAELCANHMQNYSIAAKLIKAAKRAGADALKMQTYTPDTLTLDINNPLFQIKHHKWGGQTLYQLYKKTFAPWHWFKDLKKLTEDLQMLFFSTAFDKSSVDFLEELGVSVHKISSFELIDLPLIEYAAKTKKPLILSTGMATISEIREAINAAHSVGGKNVMLLKCVSSYPAKAEDMNLKTIPYLEKTFNCPVGLSDHSLDSTVAVVAVALGACMVEKHFILSRSKETPDNFFSIEPGELNKLISEIRVAEHILGTGKFSLLESEKNSRKHRKSLFITKDIKKGEIFNEGNVRSIRPAYGLSPKFIKNILGKKAKKNIKKGQPLRLGLITN